MNKLWFALIAGVFAASSISAVAADANAPGAGAMTTAATATGGTVAGSDKAAPTKPMKVKKKEKTPAQLAADEMIHSCNKAARKQKLKGQKLNHYVRICMRGKLARAAAKKEGATVAEKEGASVAKKDAEVPATKK